jgi:hypothetical protein
MYNTLEMDVKNDKNLLHKILTHNSSEDFGTSDTTYSLVLFMNHFHVGPASVNAGLAVPLTPPTRHIIFMYIK